MPKITDPYACEICTAKKQPSNGWFLARVESAETDDVKITITKWNDELADREEDLGIKHICGIDCASRWLVKQLANIYGNQVQNG